jgi:hypothetical protein
MTEFLKAVKEMMEGIEAERKAGHEEMMTKLDAHQAKMGVAHKEMMAGMRAWRKEENAGQKTTEARLECKEPTSEDMKSGADHREVPKKHAAVETGRGRVRGIGIGI